MLLELMVCSCSFFLPAAIFAPPFIPPSPQNGETALHLAAHYGKLDLINKLLALGADINAENHHVQTPPPFPSRRGT
jgi:hypothetical protein